MPHPDYQEIKDMISAKLSEPAPFNGTDNLIQLGLDSLKIMHLVNLFRREGHPVTFAQLIESPFLDTWCELLSAAKPAGAKESPGTHKIAPVKDADQNHESGVGTPFPLTDVQQAYWFGRREGQPLGGVSCHAYLELDGRVSALALELAWERVTSHHAMLGARFLDTGEQVIEEDHQGMPLVINDFRALSGEDLDQALQNVRNALSHRSLAVEKGEVTGLALSLLPQGRTRIHFDVDLLVADVQSFQNILRDLTNVYATGTAPPAPAAWRFDRYLARHRGLDAGMYDEAARYWQERLDTLPGPPALPLAKRPRTVQRPQFNRRIHLLDEKAYKLLCMRAAQRQATPAMVLLTAYATVLARWSTDPRFLINIPLFDRNGSEPWIDDVVADFTSLLLLAVDFTIPAPFSERLEQVQRQFHQDVAHAAWSGVRVQRDLVRRRPGTDSAAPVVFACNLGRPLISDLCRDTLGELSYMISQTPQVWLDFQIHEIPGALMLCWDVVEELFHDGMMDAMFGAFGRLMDHLTDAEDLWDRPFSLLPEATRLFRQKEAAMVLPEPSCCLHTLFFRHAETSPDRIALIDGGSGVGISYAELAQTVLRTSALLKSRGVCPGDAVAIILPRSREQVIAVLAVLALGGHYVPISTEQPEQRCRQILEKAGVTRVITTASFSHERSWPENISISHVEEHHGFEPMEAPVISSPDQTAYIIFTSGSTGEPKGVVLSHYAAWNTVVEINQRYGIRADDRMLGVSGLDFDLSVYDIFGLLSAGGTLVLINEEMRRNPAAWLDLMDAHTITLWNTVPILFDMLMTAAEGRSRNLASLRLAFLSGDWIGMDLPERLQRLASDCRIVAMGGATEAAIWSNAFDVTLPLYPEWPSIPYGRPLAGQGFRVVDALGRDCPDWVPGELWIGGAGVAEGYYGDPELTAERFVRQGDRRWYRTGDQGRFRPCGNLEFLGRIDFQLKIRGHRIEPGEIEAALRELPLVSDALVTADLQNTRLVAHVVPVKGVVPTPDTLSRELQGRLPAYMIPGTFSFIDAFPLTANGKIDRKALAARNVQTNEAGSSGPQDDTEQIIMDIFKTVLQINILDRHAHFFDLGANSLHMVQVQNAIQERFGRPVSILDLFEQTSVSALARFINQTLHNAPVAEKVRDRSDLRRKARKVRARH